MAGQSVNFDFTSTGADRLAGDFRKVGGNAELAAKGAKALKESLDKQQGAAPKTAAEMAALARAVRIFGDDADKAALKALAADAAIRGLGDAAGKAGRQAEEGGLGFSGLAGTGGIPGGGLGAAIAAGVALAPVLVTVGVGLAGVAAAAVSTVGPILKAGTATKQARDALASLDPAQKTAYDSLGALKTQFGQFSKALEPQVLDIFSKGLRTASGLMGDVAPVAKATGDALGVMLGQIDAEFRSRTWQDFFGFMAKNAGPDMRLLAQALLPLLDTLPKLLTTLQPIAVQMLQAAAGTARLADAAVTLNTKIQALGTKAGTSGGMMGRFADAAKRAIGQILPGVPAAQKLLGALDKMGATSDKAGGSVKALGTAQHDTAPVTQLMADNLYVESVNAALAKDSVTTLNTAWSAFLGLSAGLETAQLGIIGTLKTMATDAGKAGASFTGVNDQSVTLQTTFESSLIPSVENVIGSMRQAHAKTHDLAVVIATDLKPAVDAGALSNTAYKNQLYDLAVQAGYTGPNKLAPLKTWFDRNASSTDAAKAAVDRYAGALAALPSQKVVKIITEASGTGQIAISGTGWAFGQGNIRFHAAAGAYIRAGTGPTADDVPAMLSKGELVVPARMVQAGAVDHLRGRVPGFAAGGLVGLGGQADAMPGQAGTIAGNLAGQAVHTGVNQAMTKAHAQVAAKAAAAQSALGFALIPGGGKVSGSAAAAQAWARAQLAAGIYGWGLSNWPALQALWMGESGWRWDAYNAGSGATGIPQSLPGSKMASAGADWRTNPVTQMRWGLAYIRSVYGSPSTAYSRWLARSPHWYSEGGLVPGYASGGLVGKEGAAYLTAWRSRHGGPHGYATGPRTLNQQIPAAAAAAARARTLATAGGLSAGQHRYWANTAAAESRHLTALRRELTVEREWRGQLTAADTALAREVAAARGLPGLAGPSRGWRAQIAAHQHTIGQISAMIGLTAAQQAAADKAHPPAPGPHLTATQITHKGQTWLNAWRSRRGGGYGAAWGPVVVNEQIARMKAAIGRARTLSTAPGLPASQHRHWAATAADETRRLAVLNTELATERAWRGQLASQDVVLSRSIAAAAGVPSLAGPVRSWKSQLAAHQYTIGQISGMLGYSDAYLKAHPAIPAGAKITHTYGGDVADTTGAFLSSVAAPFGAARGALVMDRGGWLAPGWNAPMYNATGRPEHLVPARGGGGDTYLHLTVNGPVGSQQQLEDWFIRTANKTAQHGRLTQAVRAAAR